MILTSPSGSPRGGGEVRITETERSERVSAGRRGAGPRRRRTAPAPPASCYVAGGRAVRGQWAGRGAIMHSMITCGTQVPLQY